MWWPPNKEDVSDYIYDSSNSFNRRKWAQNEETGWMIILIGTSLLLGIWELLQLRLFNAAMAGLFILLLLWIWKTGIIKRFYMEGVWILYALITLPFIPVIEFYLRFIKQHQNQTEADDE